MSPRVTRSSARLAADPSDTPSAPPKTATAPQPRSAPTARKRKAAAADQSPRETNDSPARRSKRPRAEPTHTPAPLPPSIPLRGTKQVAAAMSSSGPSSSASEATSPNNVSATASKRRTNRKKTNPDASSSAPSTSIRRSKKGSVKKDQDAQVNEGGEKDEDQVLDRAAQDVPAGFGASEEDDRPPPRPRYDENDRGDLEDPFRGHLGQPGGPPGLSSTLRALHGLHGMMSGTASRLRGLLENLRCKDDPSIQLIALQELSELLLHSTEDNLAGQFSPDAYVKELVALMQPNDFGEENPEMMLLACRCIYNLMEALPAAIASIVYGGAVPILCQKLLEIHYIDLAEQSLSTLEKISQEFPASIVREGGLTACLTYLDFFATSTQRTAVTTAANCCRSIPEESFPVVRDVMPILLNVLGSSDQKVVEQGSLCVSRVVDSFKFHESKLEDLVSADLLKAVLRLLLPGSTNMIGPNIHTQFLRVLATTARASPRLSAELLKMHVVDTLYQILTGVSPPSGTEDVVVGIDKNVIMQAIIRTPRDQIFETLNVICELLPNVSRDGLTYLDDLNDAGYTGNGTVSMSTRSKKSPNEKRLELLESCKDEVRRFAVILFPTLTHAYTSTVNLNVRQKVLTAQLKMLCNFNVDILEDALRGVMYASHLASILSQQENPTLVTFALQAAEVLLIRMEAIYRPQFYREGVIAEITKLAKRPLAQSSKPEPAKAGDLVEDVLAAPPHDNQSDQQSDNEDDDLEQAKDDVSDVEDPDEENEAREEGTNSDRSSSPSEHHVPEPPRISNVQDTITNRAKKFLEVHETESGEAMRDQASGALLKLQNIVQELRHCYLEGSNKSGRSVFKKLAKHFDGDAFESVTSHELLNSGIVEALLLVFTSEDDQARDAARTAFLEVFMSSDTQSKGSTSGAKPVSTAFGVLVHKLQDLLSRNENFDVITVHHNAFDSNRGSGASMLMKQLRLKLVADDDSGIPRSFRSIMVSIHAIAEIKSLGEYLRPRISLAERPRNSRTRDGLMSAMAAQVAAMTGRLDGPPTPSLPHTTTPLAHHSAPPSQESRAKPSNVESTAQPSSSAPEQNPSVRRSSRRHSANKPLGSFLEPLTALDEPEDAQDHLECVDETQLDDDDEDDEDDAQDALDALVDDLKDEMESEIPDPAAVNLEIANTGKVTARREDGTRVATPQHGSQGSAASRPTAYARFAAARELLSTPTSSSRPMSYAAAVNTMPQDWHLEFSIGGQPIPGPTTIYRAVHFNQAHPDDVSSRNIWSTTHTIKMKRAEGPPPPESTSLTPPTESVSIDNGLPPSLTKNPVTSTILRLLSILHELNANLDDVLAENKEPIRLNPEPLAQFVNTKLTAKLNRQLEEPLLVASNCLPTWSEDLARLYPFLFPFETRHLFLQSTSFGYSRSMARWQNAQSTNDSRPSRRHEERPYMGRSIRQKVRISRSRILESAIKVMELYGSASAVLEVEYFEEVGTGLGPTLEFYSTVSREFCKKKMKMWRENETSSKDEFAFGKHGLFPAPMSEKQANSENGKRVLHLFKMLGKFVARSMLDSRIIDVSLNPTFFRIGDGSLDVLPSLGAVAAVDEDLAKSLKLLKHFAGAHRRIAEDPRLTPVQKVHKQSAIEFAGAKIEDIGLDFTLPGYPSIELQPNGANIHVTIDNVGVYVEKVIEITLGSGVQRQVDAFRHGFSSVFPYSALKAFTPDELVMLFGRVDEDWSLETLMDSIKADHGFNLDSRSVRNLLQTMSELQPSVRREFLQFVTGSPKLPIGGFKALTPMFTVVCKPSEPPYTSDDYLPSVMTCVNYLKMPDYSSLEVLKRKLGVAIREGQGAFHLS
ncbi:Ubiquitin fusion degradation protein 4 [Elasticomyces elasticus]|nr:Ubiquitin fusion degradation protein 4 [Elasticomyces elasticus]